MLRSVGKLWPLLGALALVSGLLSGCSDEPTSIQVPSFIRGAGTDFASTRWDTTRSFIVSAGLQDTITPFPLSQRVPAFLNTSGGDHEQFVLARTVCPENRRLCHVLDVGLVPEIDLTRLAVELSEQGARIRIITGSRTYAGVFVYDPSDLARIAYWLARRREVRYVENSGLAFCGLQGCAPGPVIYTGVTGGIRLRARTGTPTHFDHHLEVIPGDTITVSIEQPDGTFYRFQQIAGPWGTGGVIGAQ